MSLPSAIAGCVLSLAIAPAALAQASGSTTTESTMVTNQVKAGVVQSVAGNKVVLAEADGLHEYNVPDGFKFQLDGQPVGVDQLKPGMRVGAVITDKITTRQVTLTRIAGGTVVQIAPGGIVLQDPKSKELKSYNFKDAAGNDIYFVRDGKEVSLRDVKQGERLTGTFVSTLPAQQISQRTVDAKAVAPAPAPAPEPTAVAAATPRRLPKTASPLPLLGLLSLVTGGIAVGLRAARRLR